MKEVSYLLLFLLAVGCGQSGKKDHQIIEVYKTEKPPTIDGKALEECWNAADWHALDQNWLGNAYTHEDFNGRYKLSWNSDALYLLVEISDDILYDKMEDPLQFWWDDDCVEVFIDEDNSGGNHQYTHNAFAYHIALDGNVVDMAPDKNPRLYNDHIQSTYTTEGTTSIWEIAITLYDDSYVDGKQNEAKKIDISKKIGFALAYCDNDQSEERENFIGSVFVPGEDKNQGWITADIFGTLVLRE